MASVRERSPNYPAYSLPQAAGFANMFYEKERRSPAPLEAAAKALGSESLSGPARSKLAALRHFGLLESAGPGRVKLSDRALVLILHRPDDSEFLNAAKEAALEPTLFSELYNQFGESSNESLRIYLIKDRGFSEDGAKRAISTYRETMDFARLTDGSVEILEAKPFKIRGPELKVFRAREPQPRVNRALTPTARTAIFGEPERSTAGPAPKDEIMSFNWLLSDGVEAHLMFPRNRPTPRSVQRLIDYLQFLKSDLAIESEDTTSSEPADSVS